MHEPNRRDFLRTAAAGAAGGTLPGFTFGADDAHAAVQAEIVKRHAEDVKTFQNWVRHPAIAAENRGMAEGCQLMMTLAKEASIALRTAWAPPWI